MLRVAIGWHFLYSGLWKLNSPEFSSEGFLSQAKGPLAEHFHELIPDYDHLDKLDADEQLAAMKAYVARFAVQNNLDAEQKSQADAALKRRSDQLEAYLTGKINGKELPADTDYATIHEELADHLHQWDRLRSAKVAPDAGAPFQQRRNWDKQSELRSQGAGWAAQVDAVWDGLRTELADVFDDPRDAIQVDQGNTMQTIDRIVTYTNVAIGACLIAGLFTRLAAFGGFLFLLQIVAAQPDWPGLYPEPHPSAGRALIVNKEFVEMTALFALMLLPVGRWAGLDFFVHHLLVKPFVGSKGTK